MPNHAPQPLLLIDVDGVISLWGFDHADPPAGRFQLVDGIAHFLSATAGECLLELTDEFDAPRDATARPGGGDASFGNARREDHRRGESRDRACVRARGACGGGMMRFERPNANRLVLPRRTQIAIACGILTILPIVIACGPDAPAKDSTTTPASSATSAVPLGSATATTTATSTLTLTETVPDNLPVATAAPVTYPTSRSPS